MNVNNTQKNIEKKNKETSRMITREEFENKCEFFNSLPSEEKGELIELGLYTQSGDYTAKHSEFFDDFAERLDKEITNRMATRDASERP